MRNKIKSKVEKEADSISIPDVIEVGFNAMPIEEAAKKLGVSVDALKLKSWQMFGGGMPKPKLTGR